MIMNSESLHSNYSVHDFVDKQMLHVRLVSYACEAAAIKGKVELKFAWVVFGELFVTTTGVLVTHL